jgi:hypothetical protein
VAIDVENRGLMLLRARSAQEIRNRNSMSALCGQLALGRASDQPLTG